jgi:hypothetical protein
MNRLDFPRRVVKPRMVYNRLTASDKKGVSRSIDYRLAGAKPAP